MSFVGRNDVAFLGTGPVSTEPYISPQFFALEQQRIFRRVWLFAARIEELPHAGDYLVKEFDVCRSSVLLVKARDGVIRAFHNICSHRQARLVWSERGNARNFSCAYHGWGYALNGELKTVPDAESFFDFDARKCGLQPIHLDIWQGFIFICFADKPEQSLREYLGEAATKMEVHSFAGCDSFTILGSEVPVNWKAMLDNFSETYHLSFIHRMSTGDRSIGKENPFGYPLNFEFYGPHRYMGIWGNPEHKPALIEGLAARFGGVISSGATQHGRAGKIERHPNWQLDVFGIFPNVLFEMAPGFFFVQEFMPITLDRTRWQLRIYLPRARTAGQRFSQEYNIAAFRDTDAEDMNLLRTLQASMASGAIDSIRFQVNEALCRHSYNTVLQYVGARVSQEFMK